MNYNVNMMNFVPIDIGVFVVEIRSAKRPYVSRTVDRRVELPKSSNSADPKKPDIVPGLIDKTILKSTISHKLLAPKAKQTPRVMKTSDQAI